MLCVQLWSVVRSQGKTMPTGGTLLIGREQDCEGGCFDSAPGELPAVLPLQTKGNSNFKKKASIGINHSVNMSMELCDVCVLIKHSLTEPERSDNIVYSLNHICCVSAPVPSLLNLILCSLIPLCFGCNYA